MAVEEEQRKIALGLCEGDWLSEILAHKTLLEDISVPEPHHHAVYPEFMRVGGGLGEL